jgi:hypothetical protein
MQNRRAWWVLGCVILAAASCGAPRPLAGGEDASIDADPGFGLELVAGDLGGGGNVDGTGAAARFRAPLGVAVDSAGTVYVADEPNHTIRKITPGGIVTTLAGSAGLPGRIDGVGAAARFTNPFGVAVDGAGNVYVADTGNDAIRVVTPVGDVTTLAGGSLGSGNGTGTEAQFDGLSAVAVDAAGNVYVADTGNHTIRKVTAAGVVTTLAGLARAAGSTDNTGAAARFRSPSGVAVDAAGNVYVADTGNQIIRKVTAAGVVTTLAGQPGMAGAADGVGSAARLRAPFGVAVDQAGTVYVADQFNDTVRKITAAGVVTTLAGSSGVPGNADGAGAAAGFSGPHGMAVDQAGSVYVADTRNATIRKITAAGDVTTLAGSSGRGSADGVAGAARFDDPAGVAVDSAGTIYVADSDNNSLRRISAAGIVTTLAGRVGVFGSEDGTGADAQFTFPSGVAVDSAGLLYVTDVGNATIRVVTPTGAVTTLAGVGGMQGSTNGTGPAARFVLPHGVTIDGAGNVYVADQEDHTIRKVTATGVVTALAGSAGALGSNDGTGASARFNTPSGAAVDSAGNIYVADTNNHTIRKVTATGVVSTLAGRAGKPGSADGTGADARFNVPLGVAVDSAGNVYVADFGNATIRKITPGGVTTTVAGTAGVSGIRFGAVPQFGAPEALAIVGDSLVIADTHAIVLLRHGAR